MAWERVKKASVVESLSEPTEGEREQGAVQIKVKTSAADPSLDEGEEVEKRKAKEWAEARMLEVEKMRREQDSRARLAEKAAREEREEMERRLEKRREEERERAREREEEARSEARRRREEEEERAKVEAEAERTRIEKDASDKRREAQQAGTANDRALERMAREAREAEEDRAVAEGRKLEAEEEARRREEEAARVEAARVEAERVEAARVEAERVEAARVEAARIEAERVEADRRKAEEEEAARLEALRVAALPKKTVDFCVVGGGVSGLVAARTLKKKSPASTVAVLESSPSLGGRVATVEDSRGYKLDVGFAVFIDSYPVAAKALNLKKLRLRPFQPGALVATSGGWLQGKVRASTPKCPALRSPFQGRVNTPTFETRFCSSTPSHHSLLTLPHSSPSPAAATTARCRSLGSPTPSADPRTCWPPPSPLWAPWGTRSACCPSSTTSSRRLWRSSSRRRRLRPWWRSRSAGDSATSSSASSSSPSWAGYSWLRWRNR